MYSMNYIGKFINNFREFYNEINGATLTGAIDVVVVEQPDGSFTCSPFHVRFGKLGVLRSRFKVVDLELNGEPLNIHMKLGESGEAFFVEEVPEDEVEWSAHLATSPIPDTRFEEYFDPPRRRNSISVGETSERSENQISDYSQRRYTDSTMEKPDFSKKAKEYRTDQESTDCQEHEALFEMEGIDDVSTNAGGSWNEPTAAPKTFAATRVGEEQSEANETVRKISVHNDFRAIADVPVDDLVTDDVKNGNGKKKKKTKKAGTKKKHQRKSSSSSNGYSSQSERAGSEPRQTPAPTSTSLAPPNTDLNFFSDSELNTAAISASGGEMSKLGLHDKRIPLALSDTAFEVSVSARHTGAEHRGDTPVQSDTEAELARNAPEADKPAGQSWRWGELPEPPPRAEDPASPPPCPPSPLEPLSSDEERTARRGMLSNMFNFMKSREERGGGAGGGGGGAETGVYLAELAGGRVDPDLYFPKHHAPHAGGAALRVSLGGSEEDYESGNGPSLPQSPASLGAALDSDDDDKLFTKGYVGVYLSEDGNGATISRALSYEELLGAPELLASARLLVRVGDRYLPWAAAGPLLLCLLAYRRQLPHRVLESLSGGGAGGAARGRDSTPETASKSRGYLWWGWRRSQPADHIIHQPNDTKPPTDDTKEVSEAAKASLAGVPEAAPAEHPAEEAVSTEHPANESVSTEPPLGTEAKEDAELTAADEKTEEADNSLEDANTLPTTEGVEALPRDADWEPPPPPRADRTRHSADRFRKTLRLSSDQIASLNLKEGMNEMVFSVTTAYQGTTRCKCNLFRWRHDDKVVISDIDGTITKSDVLGHIFPLVGKDWAQSGVAQLFTKIKNNGYKLLYLSARAIGQAKVTREYLRSIRQGEVSLPDGPLLLNPTSLLRAFHREVIEKKPEEFKIQCLADIKALFPHDSNPFYAGYGNRVNDVCAYQTVGIPIVRIFTINYRGELKHELTQTFQSTYSHMSVLVDQVFPPCLLEPCDDFSQAVYWREPLPAFDLTLPSIQEAAD